ncbi:unnamed protein product [Meloidogyne enterolobii]|uniref:Uncharacterized protein n=1 Tax=Meloidogyne enterolobii TaxID=390850 RepID=A0ACB0ZN09_MELEN
MTAILMLGHNNNSNKQQKLQKQNSMPIVERQLSVIFDTIDFTQVTSPLKPLAELCRLRCKKARLEPKNISEQLPESLWIKIFSYLGPLERISLGQCSRRLQLITSHWLDVNSLEIRPEWANGPSICPSPPPPPAQSQAISTGLPLSSGYRRRLPSLRSKPKNQPKSFHLRFQLSSGHSFRIKTINSSEDSEQPERLLKILLCRLANGQLLELTIWDACLSERLRNCIIRCSQLLRCLRLWNCGRWLNTYHPSPLLISLIGLTSLKQLFILDSTTINYNNSSNESANSFFSSSSSPTSSFSSFSSSTSKFIFSKNLAKAINAPLEELQLTNCRLSLSALELILPKCSESLKRLSIGCTFGKEQKRIQYLQLLCQFKKLNDLDLPPFIFHLGDQPKPDILGQKFLKEMTNLRAIGFRHFNSSALFRFIEFYLPKNIRVLRVHHNARRIPNFAEIGGMSSNCSIQEPISTTTKTSLNSCSSPSLSFSNYFSSSTTSSSYQKKYSKGSLFSNNSSIDSSNNDINLTIEQQQNIKLINLKKSSTFHTSSSPRIPSSACSTISWPGTNNSTKEDEQLSLATSSTWCTLSTDLLQNKDNKIKEKSSNVNKLFSNRKLTIFAIAEERQINLTKRNKKQQRLRKCKFNGIEVIYVSAAEAQSSQEVLGRMGSPIQSPYVYTTNQNNNQPSGVQRVIHGDLVKTIPLSSLGMESDWESDIE